MEVVPALWGCMQLPLMEKTPLVQAYLHDYLGIHTVLAMVPFLGHLDQGGVSGTMGFPKIRAWAGCVHAPHLVLPLEDLRNLEQNLTREMWHLT